MPVGRELLAEPNRRRVLQVRPPGLDDVVEGLSLGQERPRSMSIASRSDGSVASVASRMAVGITSLVLCAMLT